MLQLGRMLTADTALRVSVRGSEAYSAPGEIVLPALAHFSDLGVEGAERILHGLVDHEVGHALDTEHARYAEIGGVLRLVANLIEDGVIERRRGHYYPGSRFNFAEKNRYFWRGLRGRLGEGSPFLWRVIAVLGLLVRPDGAPELAEVEQLDPSIVSAVRLGLEVIGDLGPVADAGGSPTETCIALARAVLDALGIDPTSSEDLPAAAPMTPEAAIGAAIAERLASDDDGAPYTVFDPSFDLEAEVPGDVKAYARLAVEAAPTTARLAEVFEAELHSRVETRWLPAADTDDERAEIDDSLLSGFALGAEPADAIWLARTGGVISFGRPAVAVLVDCSGSMDHAGRVRTAQLCAVACHEALDRVHVPHEIAGYTSALSGHRPHAWFNSRHLDEHFASLRGVLVEAAARGERLSTYARTCQSDEPEHASLQVVAHGVFKSFDSPDAAGLTAVSGIANNLDGESVLWQARRLAQRPEARKVLIVLSDGLPNGSNRRAQGERYLAESVRRVTASGIEVYGIGIGTDHVRHYYPHWRVCPQVKDLPDALASVLRDAVLGAA